MKEKFANCFDQAIYANGFTPVATPDQISGFSQYAASYRQLPEKNQKISLAFDFIKNQEITKFDRAFQFSVINYLSDTGLRINSLNDDRNFKYLEKFELPNSIPLEISLGAVISQRRSCRNYTGDKISRAVLATILRAGNGVSAAATVELEAGETCEIPLRTVSSAGGLYPVEIFLAINNVDNLKRGLYRYHSLTDSLYQIGEENLINEIYRSISVNEESIAYKFSNVILFYVIRPWKSMRKYGPRGLKFTYHEVGSIAQNVLLAATALGLGGVECASYYDAELHNIFDLDGKFSSIAHMTMLGVPG